MSKLLTFLLDTMEEDFDGKREMNGVHYTVQFDDYYELMMAGKQCFADRKNDVLDIRKSNELHFHNFLNHQMFSRLQEIKYYSHVNINDTRRLVAVSADCISLIQILVRDKIHLMVHFRSSDFDGALPADLEFLSRLPLELIMHLSKMKINQGYEEVNDQLIEDLKHKYVKMDLSFGSLHRTN